jgi:indole-3-glycerol phosphate synthase
VGVIAEVKRRSPSAGAIREEADPVETALLYEKGGASAISVLTDLEYFGGTLGDIERVTSHTKLPVIRKDFIIDELQILEARNAGASAVLLIVRLLGRESLRALRDIAHEAGMVALVEVHDDEELDIAIDSGARIIGVNNRDLDTLTIDLAVSERLIPRIPKGVTAVAESGLRSPDDVRRMADAGADAVLVGEALMRDGTHDGAAAMTCIPRIGRA